MLKKLLPIAATAALLAIAPAAAEEMDLDKNLDEVIAAHFDAIGGEEGWRALETVTMAGTMTLQTPNGPIEAPFNMWFKVPNMTRMEFTVQGMTGIQAYDGESAWMVMPFMTGSMEPEAMPAEMAEQLAEQADINPFLDWKDKGYEVELMGKEDVDGTMAYKIQLTRPSGNVRTYYFDADAFVPFRVEGKTKFQGQEIDAATTLGNYDYVGDLVFPHQIEIRQGGPDGPAQVLTFQSIEVGTDIPESKFDMEAAAPPSEEEEAAAEG